MSPNANEDTLSIEGEHLAESSFSGNQFIDARAEKDALLGKAMHPRFQHRPRLGSTGLKSLLFAMLSSCLLLALLLGQCLPTTIKKWQIEESSVASFDLVKDAVPIASATPSSTAVLEVFQVYQPVLTPSGATDETLTAAGDENTTTIAQSGAASSCQVTLMVHSFGYSYGIPFVGNYTPPSCDFNRVSMNFTVTSRGRQFDRLALMYFNDTEVWRTSTAEPTVNGIRWEYIKDMSEFMYFWNEPQKLIFDLGNLIDNTYTGFFNTTLTASFFTAQDTVEPADLIIPISKRQGAASSASLFTLPSDNATNTISFPRNVNRAVFSVSACGQATEEFWWGNVLQSDINTFVPYDGTLYGYSPFREVQVLIDGQLAGVQWPFPVIFTGGVVPGLWRPIVGIDAFDLREHEIDITPWLPVLCNGAQHSFEIRVVGIVDDGKTSGTLTQTVGASWYVTGKIFVWLDDDVSSVTTGKAPTLLFPEPTITLSQSLTQNSTGANKTLAYTTDVKRTLSVSSSIATQNGTQLVTWSQNLAVTNYGQYTDFGAIQINDQKTTGLDESTGGTYYKSSYSYPLWANTSYIAYPSGNYTIGASLVRGLNLDVQGTPVFPTGLQPFAQLPNSASLVSGFSGTSLSTTQNGTASYFADPAAGVSSGFGSTSQEFSFKGIDINSDTTDTELYYRSVEAVNSTIVKDYESLVGIELGSYGYPVEAVGSGQKAVGVMSPKAALGRGPGLPKEQLVQGGGND
ncbi:related to peptide-n4-(n-acetyl-beta-d-glucosaminyl) asparaginase amidase N [Phialocephala subalpina]|uniref:Related to peptide-n4-(N-acetyl-beta-d-glucosaminyl) asparaginase amidase N n=1 Tax=Phialocephala subalpina TaxID=576137 RepID=A0A1L7X3F5_9HELO|nr:related to peptide-n4-(n-acetyl-beta-d-glucosaminyl) asparaginase amidase N [Phialocephala subalpina]